jgi:hypothetical protein
MYRAIIELKELQKSFIEASELSQFTRSEPRLNLAPKPWASGPAIHDKHRALCMIKFPMAKRCWTLKKRNNNSSSNFQRFNVNIQSSGNTNQNIYKLLDGRGIAKVPHAA